MPLDKLPSKQAMKQHLKESRVRLINTYGYLIAMSSVKAAPYRQTQLPASITKSASMTGKSTPTSRTSPNNEDKRQQQQIKSQLAETKEFRDMLETIRGVSKKMSLFTEQMEAIQAHTSATKAFMESQTAKSNEMELFINKAKTTRMFGNINSDPKK